jgi:hypothetical protein
MQIAVLPLNAGSGARPGLARQLSNFACEIARNVTGKEVHAVNYMAQFPDEGVTRFAMVNPSESLNENEMVAQFFQQAEMETLVDGLLNERDGGGGTVTLRVYKKGVADPEATQENAYLPGGIFGPARSFVELLVKQLDGQFPEALNEDENLFGTTDPEAFENFMLGFEDPHRKRVGRPERVVRAGRLLWCHWERARRRGQHGKGGCQASNADGQTP